MPASISPNRLPMTSLFLRGDGTVVSLARSWMTLTRWRAGCSGLWFRVRGIVRSRDRIAGQHRDLVERWPHIGLATDTSCKIDRRFCRLPKFVGADPKEEADHRRPRVADALIDGVIRADPCQRLAVVGREQSVQGGGAAS